IRLIQLHPGKTNEIISFELIERHLDEAFEYRALSYVWGDTSHREEVTCCGRSMSVTSNLHGALRRMRSTYPSGLLWADAICINQTDTIEKTSQVQMVTEIYARAQLVLIWLSEEDIDDELGIKFMYQFTEAAGWLALWKFLRKPWFSRAWIVQEFVVAGECLFLCGHYTIPADVILSAGLSIRRYQNVFNAMSHDELRPGVRIPPIPIDLMDLRNRYRAGEQQELLVLAFSARYQNASDVRDKLYAYCGLAADLDSGFVDYEKDLRTILIQVAKPGLATQSGSPFSSFDLLCCVSGADSEIQLPSWVPNIIEGRSGFMPLSLAFPSATSSHLGHPEFYVSSEEVLHIQGKIFDKVLLMTTESPVEPPAEIYTQGTIENIGPKLFRWIEDCRQLVTTSKIYASRDDHDLVISHLIGLKGALGSSEDGAIYEGYKAFRRLMRIYFHVTAYNRSLDEKISFIIRFYLIGYTIFLLYWWRYAHKLPPKVRKWMSFNFLSVTLGWASNKIFLPTIAARLKTFIELFSFVSLTWSVPNLLEALKARKQENMRSHHRQEVIVKHPTIHAITMMYDRYAIGRRVVQTAEGLLAWTPASVLPGDLICIFQGYSVPFLLRPAGDGYRLLGGCYILDHMNHEAWNSARGAIMTLKIL
ncbi:hypothetical protein N431DRAFT_512956, partial [Stipitochalara longipes BDJ]